MNLDHLKNATWNTRCRELQELMHKGDEERSAVIAFLEDRAQSRDLTFGELKLLDAAKNYFDNVVRLK